MQFIVETQARQEVQAAKHAARMDKLEAQNAALDRRLTKRMDGVTKLLKVGMKMLAKTNAKVAELAAAQKETERTLKAFLATKNGGNGKHRNG